MTSLYPDAQPFGLWLPVLPVPDSAFRVRRAIVAYSCCSGDAAMRYTIWQSQRRYLLPASLARRAAERKN